MVQVVYNMTKRKADLDPEYLFDQEDPDDSYESTDGKDAKSSKTSKQQSYWFMVTIGVNKFANKEELTKFLGIGPLMGEWLPKLGLDLEHWQGVCEYTWRQQDVLIDSIAHECEECKEALWATFPDGVWYDGSPDKIAKWKAEATQALFDHIGEAQVKNFHYHITIHLLKKRTKKTVVGLFRVAIDNLLPDNKCYLHVGAVSTAGQQAARNYIYKKGETYHSGPWNNKANAVPQEGDLKLEDLPNKVLPWHKLLINQLASGYPGTDTVRLINVFEDESGNNMKSMFMKQMLMRYPEHVGIIKGAVDSKDLQTKIMTQVKEFGNKRMWIIDIPRTKSTKAKMEALNTEIENIKDGFYQQDKYKSDQKLKKQPWVWVFCNSGSGIGRELDTEDDYNKYIYKWSKDRAVFWEYNADKGDFAEESYALYEAAKEDALKRLKHHEELMVDCEWPVLERSQSDK